MELETDPRASLEFLPARQRQGFSSRSFDSMSTAAVHKQRHPIPDVPRYSPSTLRLAGMLTCGQQQQQQQSGSSPPDILPYSDDNIDKTTGTSSSSSTSGPSSPFRFDQTTSEKTIFNIPHRHRSPVRGVKRIRHTHDVDGPNTAGLCCKKRRLRAELITSRLSQPFSQPATHILNREGAESGDKRFLKMATSVDAIRRIAHLHATSFLRFSVMNRIRKRLGIGRPGYPQPRVYQGFQYPGPQPREVDATARAPWEPQSLQVASGAKYWRPPGAAGPSTTPAPNAQGDRPLPPPPPSSKIVPPVPRVSKPAALPMPASDLAAAKERTAPRIHAVPSPVSPELRPDRTTATTFDDAEEDSFAFLHPEFDDDEPEHVYSDFGAIFRAGSPDGGQSGEDHSYEEYLDELDGISWVTR